jgi:dihydrofolate reductase
MSKIVLYIASSLDGFIARRNGDITWLDEFNVEGEDYGYSEFLNGVDIIVMGSKTYEQVLSFGKWPYEGFKTYVLTRRKLDCVDGEGVKFYFGDLDSFVHNIKHESRKDIWLVGGATVAQTFLRRRNIDEIILSIIPIILGDGISLFKNEDEEILLDLLQSKSYRNGAVQLHYALRRY